MSRSQWYIFSSLRLAALAALIWAAGSWVDRASLSGFEKGILDFVGITLSIFLVNNWMVSHETYLKDTEGQNQRSNQDCLCKGLCCVGTSQVSVLLTWLFLLEGVSTT